MKWYESYGFEENPFTIKPSKEIIHFFGQKEIIDSLVDDIKEGKVSVVYGKYGTGKTTVMKGIINVYKGKRKLVYYNCYESDKPVDFKGILVKGGNRMSALLNIKSKEMIIILDEAHNLKLRDFENLVYYYNKGYFKSIVLVTSKIDFKFSDEIEELISNKYKLNELTEDDAVKLVKMRLNNLDILDEETIKEIFNNSKTVREFLMNCDDACRKAFERGAQKVEKEDLVAVISV